MTSPLNNKASTARLDDLETRLAFQEDTIDALNARIAEQELELSKLHVVLQHLNNKMKNMENGSDTIDSGNQPPPHY